MSGLYFADPERGVSAALRPGAAVVFDHDDVVAAGPQAAPRLEAGGNGSESAALELDGAVLEVEISQLGHSLELAGEIVPLERLTACRVLGELRRPDGAIEVACLGVRSRGEGGLDLAGAERRRSIAVAFSDGGLLALSAARPAGAGDHGAEEIVAALVGPEGEEVAIGEALLSTQYDAEGRHRRATLELWPEGEAQPPQRAGGAIVCGTTIRLGELRLDLAFFRWSMDGRPGLGSYEILSRA